MCSKLKNTKLIVFDLDGTLLDSNKRISETILDSLVMLRNRKIQYTIASARHPMMIEAFCRQLQIQIPVIGLDGAVIYDQSSERFLYERPIDKDIMFQILELCRNSGYDYTVHTTSTIWYTRNTKRYANVEAYNNIAKVYNIPDVKTRFCEDVPPKSIIDDIVFKVFIDNPADKTRQDIISSLKKFGSIRTTSSEGQSISIVNSHVSKGNALRFFLNQQKISRDAVCCFGDYYNDIEMFEVTGQSVAMGNAPEEVKAHAKYITATNNENGVSDFINHYF